MDITLTILYIVISFVTFGLHIGYKTQKYIEVEKEAPYTIILESFIIAIAWPIFVLVSIGIQIRKNEQEQT